LGKATYTVQNVPKLEECKENDERYLIYSHFTWAKCVVLAIVWYEAESNSGQHLERKAYGAHAHIELKVEI
jgi:hypothetical protein